MSVKLSKKHGVNPSVEVCRICGEDMGVILFGHITKRQAEAMHEAGLDIAPEPGVEAPRSICLGNVCDQCKEWMKEGVILIGVRDSDVGEENPHRTGKLAAVKDEFIRLAVQPEELAAAILKKRVTYIPESAWEILGIDDMKAANEGDGESRT